MCRMKWNSSRQKTGARISCIFIANTIYIWYCTLEMKVRFVYTYHILLYTDTSALTEPWKVVYLAFWLLNCVNFNFPRWFVRMNKNLCVLMHFVNMFIATSQLYTWTVEYTRSNCHNSSNNNKLADRIFVWQQPLLKCRTKILIVHLFCSTFCFVVSLLLSCITTLILWSPTSFAHLFTHSFNNPNQWKTIDMPTHKHMT